jgi:hypothetical protein
MGRHVLAFTLLPAFFSYFSTSVTHQSSNMLPDTVTHLATRLAYQPTPSKIPTSLM